MKSLYRGGRDANLIHLKGNLMDERRKSYTVKNNCMGGANPLQLKRTDEQLMSEGVTPLFAIDIL